MILPQHKKRLICGLLLTLLVLNYVVIGSTTVLALERRERVKGYSNRDEISPGEKVRYNFSDSNNFLGVTTDSRIDLNASFGQEVTNRQINLIFSNNNQSFNLALEFRNDMRKFGFSSTPYTPKSDNFSWQPKHQFFTSMHLSKTINQVTIQFNKTSEFGLNPSSNYSLAKLDLKTQSWDLIPTEEVANDSSSEDLLESTITNLEGDEDHYFTLLELVKQPDGFPWLAIIILITVVTGAISIVAILSKKDYINFLKSRTTPIDKGAHRLTLEEVLENENRNKIIDAILDDPGIHFNELLRETELAAGNLLWHLEILETYKIIGKKVVGKYVVYFPYYQKNPISNIDLKLQKSELTLKILEMIEEEPGLWNSIITKRLDVDHKTVSYHVQKLLDLNLVNIRKDGRKKKLYPNLEADYFNNK